MVMRDRIEFGDCREIMTRWYNEGVRVQTCVTSPPYFGLRDYGHDGQIGLEETPEEYVSNIVEVFRCVYNILRDDGTLWLNLGDSYAGSGKGRNADGTPNTISGMQGTNKGTILGTLHRTKTPNHKPKDLIGIPWMVAFALRADGWYLRQDIIWNKPNAMPESVKDRCTKSHEYIFLLTKSQRYYYDHEAIKEPCSEANIEDFKRRKTYGNKGKGVTGSYDTVRPDLTRGRDAYMSPDFMRNKRDVWTVNTRPFKGAHFATFPPDLITPCILAGSRQGDIVFDPFMGSGTTAMVAMQHNRHYLGCELNEEYKPLQRQRLGNFADFFTTGEQG